LYIHNPAICHSLCLSHEHSSYDVGLDNGIDNADDIDHQPNGFVYQYEKNGNLRRDNQEHIQLEWTMAGKVKKVINTLTTNTKAEFLYDAMGNRVRKTVYTSEGNVERNIFYTYAPDGKLLQMTEKSNTGLLMSMEYPLYGISRLGLYKVTSSLSREDESANLHIFPRYFDRRMYELTDHLGNVRAVVGDRKLWNSSFAGEFRANVLSVSNYYPFGMAQTGRNWDDNGNYRYGYNGKEEDNEIKTNSADNGKSLDYGARWYDPRKARWDAVDAAESKYPYLTPYHFAGNNPIQYVDYDGKDFGITIDHTAQTKTITITASFFAKNPKDNEILDKCIKSFMDQNGKFQYVTSGGVVYDIKFDITKTPTVQNSNGDNVRDNNSMSNQDAWVSNEIKVGELGNFNSIAQTYKTVAAYTNRNEIVLSPDVRFSGKSFYTISHEMLHAMGHSGHGHGLIDGVYSYDDPKSRSFVGVNTETIEAILGRGLNATQKYHMSIKDQPVQIGSTEKGPIYGNAGINRWWLQISGGLSPNFKTNIEGEQLNDQFYDGTVRETPKTENE
jgi:RHS repeat-associated protein